MTAPPTSLRPRPSPPPAARPPGGGTGGSPAADEDLQAQPWSRRHPGRVQVIGLAVSLLVHLVVLVLVPAITIRFSEVTSAVDPDAPVDVQGIEVVNLLELASDEVDSPLSPEDRVEPNLVPLGVPVVPLPGGDLTLSPPEAPPVGPTAARRLVPSTRDQRLWQPLVPEAVTLTDQEVLESMLYGQLQAFNDSMAIRAAEAARGLDWTYTDEEGNRWGISPGKLHLGKITLPLPGFGSPAGGASDDLLDRLSMDAEIRRAAGQLGADATVAERAAAIRARVDAERARRATRPDTSRGGGGR